MYIYYKKGVMFMYKNLLILFTLYAIPAHSTNVTFIPGDSFFATSLSNVNIQKRNVTFHYKILSNVLKDSGYFGALKITIHNLPPTLLQLLKQYNDKVKNQYRILTTKDTNEYILVEPTLLIYNKEFNLKHGLLLRYNEQWSLHQKRCKRDIYYPGFNNSYLIVKDWGKAHEIRGLTIDKYNLEGHFMGDESPCHIDYTDIKFILIPPCDIRDLAFGYESIPFFVFDNGNIKKFIYKSEIVREVKQ